MKSVTIFFAIFLAVPFFSNADSWIQKADFAGNPRGGSVGFSINGKGYIGTGSAMNEGYSKTFWEYDPATDAWTQKADLTGAGRVYAAAFSIGDKGYIGAGKIADNVLANDFWEYDSNTNAWTQLAIVPGGNRYEAFAFSIGDKGYLGGGVGALYTKEDFYEYDPATDIWTQKADYGGGKVAEASGFTISGRAYIGTGVDNLLHYRKDFWQYDSSLDIWTQKTDFPGKERAGCSGFAINNFGYLGLGSAVDTTYKTYSDFWKYDPITDSWLQQTDYPDGAGEGFTGVSIGDTAYVGLGGTSGKQWWQYDPDSIATSVDGEFIKQKPLTVFPNPSDGTFKISLQIPDIVSQSTAIDILDQAGKVVSSLQATFQDGLLDQQIFVKHLPAGFYWVSVTVDGKTFIAKLILQ